MQLKPVPNTVTNSAVFSQIRTVDKPYKYQSINYLLAHFPPLHFCRMIPQDYWEEIGRVLLLNAKFPYVKLSMLKTINKPKAAAGGRHL